MIGGNGWKPCRRRLATARRTPSKLGRLFVVRVLAKTARARSILMKTAIGCLPMNPAAMGWMIKRAGERAGVTESSMTTINRIRPPLPPRMQALIGPDLADKTIGVACHGQLPVRSPTPLETVRRKKFGVDCLPPVEIIAARKDWRLVLGLPAIWTDLEGARVSPTGLCSRNCLTGWGNYPHRVLG